MIRVALAGLLGRKLRTALTAFAVVLGVAMVSGTLTLTGSIDNAFNFIFTSVRQGSDAVITGKAAVSVSQGNGSFLPTVPDSLLARVRALPSVSLADGQDDGTATLIDRNGKAIVFGGAPNLGFSIADPKSPFNPLELVSGSWPSGAEVVIDRKTAQRKHFAVGDVIGVEAEGPLRRFRISGLVEFGGAASLGGATLAGFDVPTAQKLFQKPGVFDQIAVAKKPGVSEATLIAQIRSVLPKTARVRTGTAQAHEDQKQTDSFISFLRDFLLAFAGIALFVGSFVIANSLSITITQRTRELATMRTLGASRRQVLQVIVFEAFVTGVLASVTGLFIGLGLAKLLFRLFDAVGFTLPNSGIVVSTSTVVIALVAGIVVTLLASLRPALRATRVPPIAAVREGSILPPSRFARFRTLGSGSLAAIGFAALLFGLFAPNLSTKAELSWMGAGVVLVFFGVSLLAVPIVRPLAAVLGWPAVRVGGAAGRLARDNARRNPQRTASTASALMIGLALVTLVAMMAAGITASFRGAVERIWQNADYAITAQNNFSPIPPAAANAVAQTPGVEAVANVRTGNAGAFGKSFFATAVNPAGASMFRLDWTLGSQATMATLGRDGAFVDKDYAASHHLVQGSPVVLTFTDGTRQRFVVKGIFNPPTGGSRSAASRSRRLRGTPTTRTRRTSTRSSASRAARRTRTGRCSNGC